jgi:hypothetical protein
MAIKFYNTYPSSNEVNEVILRTMDYSDWQALTAYPCLRGSKITVLDYQTAGNQVVFIKNSNTDHTTASGYILDTIATATDTVAGKVFLYNTVSTNADGAVTPNAVKTYVDSAVANLVNSSPSALDTLNELATALGNDANFATTVTNGLATKWTIGGNATTAIASIGSTNNFGVSFITNNIKNFEILPVTSPTTYLSSYSNSVSTLHTLAVRNLNSIATQLKLTTSYAGNTDGAYVFINSLNNVIQMAPGGSVVAQFTPTGLQINSGGIYGGIAPFNFSVQSGNPSTTTGSGGFIFAYRNAAGTFNPTAGLYRNVQIGGVSGAFQPTGAASYIGVDLLEQINQTSGSGAITYINWSPTITSHTGVLSFINSTITDATNRYLIRSTGTLKSVLAGFMTIGSSADPTSTLTVGGSSAYAVNTVSGNLTLNATHSSVVWSSSIAGTITLPVHTTCPGRIYYLAKFGSGDLTISAATWAQGQSNYISGATFSVTLVATENGWLRLGTALN